MTYWCHNYIDILVTNRKGDVFMTYEVVEIKEKLIVGLTKITSNKDGQAAQDIGALWQELMSGVYSSIHHKVDQKMLGIYTRYESDNTGPYTFMCGAEVSLHENDDIESITIEAGKYAKFTLIGDMMEIVGPAWHQIWQMDLDRKYGTDFEYYLNDSQDPNKQTIEIYIGLN